MTWFPDVFTTTREAEGFETHRVHGDITGQNDQVSPRNFAAVFLLDRPEQAACFVKVDVVRPAVERRKALGAKARTATAIADAVSAGAVPSHAHEERAVMAVVRWPPLLRVGHQGMQVFDHRIQVQGLELFSVVEGLAHRVGQL